MNNPPQSCEVVLNSYLGSLLNDFSLVPRGHDRCTVVTPFTRPDGEAIEIEVGTQPDGTLRLSDSGDSIAFLYVNGLTLSQNMIENARRLCRRHQVELSRYELAVQTDPLDSGEKLHGLIQAILRVSEMIQRRRPSERLQFTDVVETFLVANRAVYDPQYEVQGVVARYTIRFHVDSGRRMLIQPLSATNEGVAYSWAERWAFRFSDIRDRDPDWNVVAVLDDRGERANVWSPRVLPPLRSQAKVILWKESEALAEVLLPSGG